MNLTNLRNRVQQKKVILTTHIASLTEDDQRRFAATVINKVLKTPTYEAYVTTILSAWGVDIPKLLADIGDKLVLVRCMPIKRDASKKLKTKTHFFVDITPITEVADPHWVDASKLKPRPDLLEVLEHFKIPSDFLTPTGRLKKNIDAGELNQVIIAIRKLIKMRKRLTVDAVIQIM